MGENVLTTQSTNIFLDVFLFMISFLLPLGTQLSSLIFGYIRKGKERVERYKLRVSKKFSENLSDSDDEDQGMLNE